MDITESKQEKEEQQQQIYDFSSKNISDRKKKSIIQEQHSRQGSAEQKKTSKNPIPNRERKEDKQQFLKQQSQAAKNQQNNVKPIRSVMSPLDIQRTSSAKGFLTCRQQGSLYNNFIECTTKHNLTTQQQYSSHQTSKMFKMQSQSSLNQNKTKNSQFSMLGSSKQENSPSKSTIDPEGNNIQNNTNNNQLELSQAIQNANVSSVLQNVNISEIIGVDNSSSQRSMIQRKQSNSSLIKPNSSISSSVSNCPGAANLKSAICTDNYTEIDEDQGFQANRKSSRQKSQLDLLILSNPRKTEPLIRPNCQYSSQQQTKMFKQYSSPIRETIKDVTKEAAQKQQEKLRKWKQLQKPSGSSELESSLFCTKEEQQQEEIQKDNQYLTLRDAIKHAQIQNHNKADSVLWQDINQSQIQKNSQKSIDFGYQYDKEKSIIARNNMNCADSQKENRQTDNIINNSIPNINANLKGCSDPAKVKLELSSKETNILPKSKDSTKEGDVVRNQGQDDSFRYTLGLKQQDLIISEDTETITAEIKRPESNQIHNLRESLKISIASVNNPRKGSDTLGCSSLSPGISSGLYQIQEKDSQQNTQRQQIPEEHLLSSVDWRSISLIKEEFIGQMNNENIKCPIHSEILTLYCEKDKRLLCVSCLFDSDEHQKHTVLPVKAAAGIILANSNLFKAQLKEKLTSFDAGYKKCLINRSQLERSFEKNLDMMNKEFQALKNAINQQQKALEQQIIQTYEEALCKYDALIADIKEIQTCTTESQKRAISLTPTSPLDSIAREHFIFNTLCNTLQQAHFSVSDVKKNDLDIFTVKMKQEMKNCIQEYGNVKNLSDRCIGIKIQENQSALQANNFSNSRINPSQSQQDKSYCQTARTHYASSKSSARDTTNSISPSRYDYVQRTLQAHYGSSKNLMNSQDLSQQRSKSRLKSQINSQNPQIITGSKQHSHSNWKDENNKEKKQLLASNVKQCLDDNCLSRGNSQVSGVNDTMNVSVNYAIVSKQINQSTQNSSSNNNNTKLAQDMSNIINLTHYAIDNHQSKKQNTNNNQKNQSTTTPQPEQIRNKYHSNNHEKMQNSYQQSSSVATIQQQQQSRQSTQANTVISLQSKRFRELPKHASTSIN